MSRGRQRVVLTYATPIHLWTAGTGLAAGFDCDAVSAYPRPRLVCFLLISFRNPSVT